MGDYTITVGDVVAVKIESQITAPANEAITKGDVVRYNTTTGMLTPANATTDAEARAVGIAITAATQANETITVVRRGLLDLGDIFTSANYDDDVYLSDTDGVMATTAGSATVIIGQVVPAWTGTTPDKLLWVDCEQADRHAKV
jgi:hypothetical protein